MKYSHMQFENPYTFTENGYFMPSGADAATFFALANGYMGVRGSLEEHGTVGIQGAYIRGVIDACPCAPVPVIENEYMKKWYFAEDRIRRYQSNDTIVNFADFLVLRFSVNGETFYPWEGTVLEWKRSLDMEKGVLSRRVRWENSKGEITVFEFERFASYANDNIFAIKVTVTPENYSGTVNIMSGVDILTKSSGGTGGGWLLTVPEEEKVSGNEIFYACRSGKKFDFGIALKAVTDIADEEPCWEEYTVEDGMLGITADKTVTAGKSFTVTKRIFAISDRDSQLTAIEAAKKADCLLDYDTLYDAHIKAYKESFDKIDVTIEGDDKADTALRFSNYHTLGSFNRNDSVHSLAPKGLSGPGYSGLVWWDCEVYQSPIFYMTMADKAKNMLIYRHRMLDGAKKNAIAEGCKGARYPFNSGIDGIECCWPVARHPLMQIHIVSDVAWSINNYYNCSGDDEFMLSYGMEMLFEICRYWISRVEKDERGYVIKQVTGTDEHHPYVDNNAYTNYCVRYLLDRTLAFNDKYGSALDALKLKIGFKDEELEAVKDLALNIYLPMDKESGLIPQFDGYLGLSRELEYSASSGGNMKELQLSSGLYHKSQVIKQPDVLVLFSYQNFRFDKDIYSRNWDYYRARCESSSSLSYSVHSICASDNKEPESAYTYFMETAMLDLDDHHNCVDAGVHSACAAGAWLAAVRGIGGAVLRDTGVEINPNMIPWWKSMTYNLSWHGNRFTVVLTNGEVTVTAADDNRGEIALALCGKTFSLKAGDKVRMLTSFETKTTCNF